MLRLYQGGFTSLVHDEIIKGITHAIDSGKKVFLFVPEQQTLSAEAEACDLFPASAVRSFEVTNFTRFTNTAFRTLGGISGEYITSAKKALVMWGVLTELSPMLTLTRGARNISAGVTSRALAAVNELSLLGIRPDDLRDSESLLTNEDKRLKNKLCDLSLIYSVYKSKLGEKYSDTQEDVLSLAKKLSEDGSYLENCAVFIEGFTSFTEPQYTLIKSMMKSADMTVALTMKKADKDSFEYTEIRETKSRILNIARRESVDVTLLSPDAPNPSFNPIISEVADLLWRNEGKIDNDSLQILKNNPEIIRIFEADTPFDECDFIASDIKRRVMSGERFRDFAIIARSLEYYSGILDTSLEKAGVPSFMASPRNINSFEAIKLINTAYSTIVSNFSSAEVITYSKCGLIDITTEECDLFELYVSKWNINGQRFTDGMIWNMNPRGYEALSDKDRENLNRINEIKDRIIKPLSDFAERVKDAHTVREHAEALLDFLISIDLEAKLDIRARQLLALKEAESAKQSARLWQIICDSLDILVDTVGDLPSDAESFINQLSVIFSDTNMGSIPSYFDEVTVGSADMLRLTDKKHIYLVGVNSGEFPKNVSDSSYFTDRDKATLARLGLGVTPDLEIKNARELYSLSRSFCFAKQSVTLLYTKKTSSLGSALPSEVIARITEITDSTVKPVALTDIPLLDKIYSPESALENLGKASPIQKAAIRSVLSDTEFDEILKISEGKLENDEVTIDKDTMGIIVGRDIYLSQTKIDKYLKCPFKYFASAFLGINETEKAEINQLVVGNFVHSILENVFNTVIKEKKKISDLSEEERRSITSISAKAYVESKIGESSSAKNTVIIDRIKRVAKPIVDGLCDEFANCRFTPVSCELRIGGHSPDTPNSIIYNTDDNKHRVVIGGYIDRLDTLKIGEDVYVRVVDYKTGIKNFSLDDVKKGENLQMLLYLKSVVDTDKPSFRQILGVGDGGKVIPGGIVYVKTSVKDVAIDTPSDELALSEVKKSFERLGATFDNEEVLAAMNPDFTPMEKPKSKNDAPTPITFNAEDWSRICDEMKSAVLAISDEILNGHICAKTNVSANSQFHPCEDCQYKFICRSAVK